MRSLAMTAVCLSLTIPAAAEADIFSKSKKKVFGTQTAVLDPRAKQQYKASVRLEPVTVVTPTK